jgi:hypothetical protein
MKTIREAAARKLSWRLAKDTYELRSGHDLLATLRILKGRTLFLAEAAEGRWTFKRTGFFRVTVTVRLENSSTELAMLRVSGSAGTLELSNGGKFHWTASHREWSFNDETGKLLVGINSKGNSRNLSGEVELAPAVLALPDASLLVLLGWYCLILLASEEEAVAGALISSVAGA